MKPLSVVTNLLRPALHIAEITDSDSVQKKYKYWRIRIFYSMYAGYLFYYFTRKSFTFITPFLISDLGLSLKEIGILASILSISYGISKFASGILSDRSNPRYFMGIGLILTGFCNILFGFSSSVWMLGIFWALNGWFQGWGWPACTKLMTHWYSRTERGTWWSACATSHTVGGFAIAFVAAYCAQWFGWRFGMFIPGILCVIVGCWLLNRLRDVPQSLGLPDVEKFRGEVIREEDHSTEILPAKRILFDHVLNNKYIWVLALSCFFIYVVRAAVNDWGPLYLTQMKGYNPVDAAKCVSVFEVGGFFGILAAGWGSDYWFQGRRVPLMVISSFASIFAVLGLWYLLPGQFLLTSLLIGGLGFLVFVPQMLGGLAAAEFVSKKAASTSNGFVAGAAAYLGAAMAGFPLGSITQQWGWYGFIATLIACSVISMAVLLPIWSARGGRAVADEITVPLESSVPDAAN